MARTGAVLAVIGAIYLLLVGGTSSWWYVPALVELGPGTSGGQTPAGGPAFFLIWGVSGVLGAIVVALGAMLYASVDRLRVLLLALGAAALLLWLMLWTAGPHGATAFGIGGSAILICFLAYCLEWARTRRHGAVADLRLASHACFFVAAWGLCGLLGAPIFLLRPEMHAGGGETMALKTLLCLVLGWLLTAVAQHMERRGDR